MSSRKLFINSSQNSVNDSLCGFVLRSPHLLLAEKERIVLRRDFHHVKSRGHVTLLSGGGSGHEPAHSGFVGRGMLTATVSGDIFASPPINHILTALRTLASPAGTVVIVKNYTGDRLNFGLAVEQFRAEAIGGTTSHAKVAIVLVEDDCATSTSSAGARGLCGTILMHKILGAMAEQGACFQEILDTAKILTDRMATLSAALGHCNMPSDQLTNHVLTDNNLNVTYEIGLGIHNEPGIAVRTLESIVNVVSGLLDTITNNMNTREMLQFPSQETADEADGLVVVVSNLGGLSELEVNTVVKEVVTWFEEKHLRISGLIVGTLMTSLDMPGFSITLLDANDATLQLLSYPTDCVAWPGMTVLYQDIRFRPEIHVQTGMSEASLAKEDSLSDQQADIVLAVFKAACSGLVTAESHLNYLDSVAGDGDCGTTLAKLAHHAAETVTAEKGVDFGQPSSLFRRISLAAADIGGTTGALYGILFHALANEMVGKKLEIPVVWSRAVTAAVASFVGYSRAKRGDKSMLDALLTISDGLSSLPKTADDFASVLTVLRATEKSCHCAVEETRNMAAAAGRAGYSSSREDLEKVPDAGAYGVWLWFSAIVGEIERSLS